MNNIHTSSENPSPSISSFICSICNQMIFCFTLYFKLSIRWYCAKHNIRTTKPSYRSQESVFSCCVSHLHADRENIWSLSWEKYWPKVDICLTVKCKVMVDRKNSPSLQLLWLSFWPKYTLLGYKTFDQWERKAGITGRPNVINYMENCKCHGSVVHLI